ncbi:unnamed protein product [Paramecium primaurelia]|uniref:Ribosome biogenesis protein BOP1 homolog n=1 Tax=Paramecium primaurelia TaxID=5886 RepID=A0A8S1N6E3_PARPR|nr:unnamed protein product [Paramecium primaurelia]
MNQNNTINIRAIRNKKSIKKDLSLQPKNIHDQFYQESDDSEDEKILSKIGRLQTKKYKDKDFIGYDENLNKIQKKKQFQDTIDEFINKTENKDWWRVVRDELNNQDVVLSDKQLQMLDRIRTGKTAIKLADDYYFEHEDFNQFDLLSSYNPKRRFLPSKWERIKINKLVQGIKLGRIVLNPPQKVEKMFDIWENVAEDQVLSKYLPARIPAAKASLPSNVASYNPPEEYLFTEQEKQQWLQTDPEDRDIPFIPQKFKHLRNVPSSEQLTKDLFNRCLDLYLAPRIRRKKLMMKSTDFLPEIPKPEELKPFPTKLNFEFGQIDTTKSGQVKQISISQDGQLLGVCYEFAIAFFDTKTTKCLYTKWQSDDKQFLGLDFSQSGLICILQSNGFIILNSYIDKRQHPNVEDGEKANKQIQKNSNNVFEWNFELDDNVFQQLLEVKMPYDPLYVQFHSKSDYIVSTQPHTHVKSHCILVHSISKSSTSIPFQNMKASTEVQQTIFHPTKPELYIMTNKNIFIYSLTKQSLMKKLLAGNQQNSTIAIHPYGDNLIVGSNDQKVCWFDLDMGKTPFKKMSYHKNGVRRVIFHKTYPLFASCSDDGTINIFHCRISTDLNQAPVILPLKVLKQKKKESVMDVAFHPTQPWIYSASKEGVVSLWT